MKHLLFILLAFFTLTAFGQPTGNIEEDTAKANRLYEDAMSSNDSSKTMSFCNEALELYQSYPFSSKTLEIKSLKSLVLIPDRLAALELAKEVFAEAEKNNIENDNPILLNAHIVYSLYHTNPLLSGKSSLIAYKKIEKPSKTYFLVINKIRLYFTLTNSSANLKPIINEIEDVLNKTDSVEAEKYWIELYTIKSDYYVFIGDYEKGIIFGKKVIEEAKKYDNLIYTIDEFIKISISYGFLGDTENGLFWLEKVIDIIEENKSLFSNSDIVGYYNGIAFCYYTLGDYSNTLEYLKKKSELLALMGNGYTEDLMLTYANIGQTYIRLFEFQRAKKYLALAIQLDSESVMVLEDYATVLYELKEYDTALIIIQRALIHHIPTFTSEKFEDNPEIWEFTNNTPVNASILEIKSQILYRLAQEIKESKPTKALFFLQKSIETNLRAVDVENIHISKLTGSNSSKLSHIKQSVELPFESQYEVYRLTEKEEDLDKIFEYIERSKARMLLETISPNLLPKNLQEQKTQLINVIQIQEQNLLMTQDSSDFYQQKLFEAHVNMEKFINKIQKDYPEEAVFWNKLEFIKVGEIQKTLKPKTLLINYKISEDKLFIFTVSKLEKNITVVDINGTKLSDEINKLQNLLQNPLLIQTKNTNEFIELSHKLYTILIEPIKEKLDGKENFICITDFVFFNVPFEILLSSNEKKSFSELDFLIKKYNTKYHYSATTYMQLKNKPRIKNNSLLAFAPVFTEGSTIGSTRNIDFLVDSLYRGVENNSFASLPNTKKEVQSIAKTLNGKGQVTMLLESDATKANLNQAITKQSYQFVHIATHGLVNYQNPLFSALACHSETEDTEQQLLFANEIQMKDIQADLVVLSSCESGIGQLVSGEGLIALNRSYIISGANNVMFSLWKVSDTYSAELMIDFYKFYLETNDYSAALRQAKLKMLKNPRTANPRYWAAFVLIGE